MREAETINWGIIGCGDVTEKKSGPAFSAVDNSRLVAVMRRDLTKAQDYARRHVVPRAYGKVDDLLADAEVNAVYIATPPGSHAELARQVAAAGMPCYVEKPMARTSAECHAMVEAFRGAGQPLYVAYYRRALPHFARVKTLIESEELGTLREAVYALSDGHMLSEAGFSDWRFDPAQAGGGLLWDLGSHALDLLDFFVGPLEGVSGHWVNQTGRTAVEETAALTARSEAGASVVAHWNFISPVKSEKMILRFDAGQVECSVFGPPEVVLNRSGEIEVENYDLPAAIQFPLIRNVVASLKGEEQPLSTGESALRTNQVLDQLTPGRPS